MKNLLEEYPLIDKILTSNDSILYMVKEHHDESVILGVQTDITLLAYNHIPYSDQYQPDYNPYKVIAIRTYEGPDQ